MGASQRNKGHNFERKVAADLRAIFPEAKRGFQTRGGTAEAPDVDGTPFYIECKAHKKVDREAAFWQAELARADKDSRPTLAVCKDDRQPPVAYMKLSTLLWILGARGFHDPAGYEEPVEILWRDLLTFLAEARGHHEDFQEERK